MRDWQSKHVGLFAASGIVRNLREILKRLGDRSSVLVPDDCVWFLRIRRRFTRTSPGSANRTRESKELDGPYTRGP